MHAWRTTLFKSVVVSRLSIVHSNFTGIAACFTSNSNLSLDLSHIIHVYLTESLENPVNLPAADCNACCSPQAYKIIQYFCSFGSSVTILNVLQGTPLQVYRPWKSEFEAHEPRVLHTMPTGHA